MLEKDLTKDFLPIYSYLQVVQDSGWGWDHFSVKAAGDADAPGGTQPQGPPDSDSSVPGGAVRAVAPLTSGELHHQGTLSNVSSVSASVGHLYAVKTLDYENEAHRKGFRFLVQVTDRVS